MLQIFFYGLLSGFISQLFYGLVFTNSWVQSILFDPNLQSQLFRELAPTRNIPYSILGLIVWSSCLGFLYVRLKHSMDGYSIQKKSILFGTWIWALYWLPQEWFIYHTLLQEPIILCMFELMILWLGSVIQSILLIRLVDQYESK